MKLQVTVSKTSRGDQDYLQVISDDQCSVNVVLIANKVEIVDVRGACPDLCKLHGKLVDKRPKRRRD